MFTVEEVTVTLQPFQQVATLDQLWDQTATASLKNGNGTILIDVASGSLAASQTGTLVATGADLERLDAALESGNLSASLVGHTSQSRVGRLPRAAHPLDRAGRARALIGRSMKDGNFGVAERRAEGRAPPRAPRLARSSIRSASRS